MNQIIAIWRKIMKLLAGMLWGFLFGVFFLSGLAFLAGRQIYYETSDSMQPVIEKGSLLFVREKEEYQEGDIVAFYTDYGGQLICVTHRIVDKVASESYITKGDANDRADRCVITGRQIFGQVTEYIPYLGYVCYFIQQNNLVVLFALGVSVAWSLL